MQYNQIGDALWAPLSSVKLLSMFSQSYDSLPVQGLGISALNPDTLTKLSLGPCPIVDAALPEIATFVNLTSLILELSKITDAGIAALAPLKKLENLNVRNTAITPAGLAALKGIPLTRLGYGRSMPEFTAGISEVAALFPGLTSFILPRDVDPAPEQWAMIAKAFPKVNAFFLNSQKFGDASCVGLDAFPDLEALQLLYCPIGDTGIAALAANKKLRDLIIADATITDGSLDVLAEMRSLKALTLPKPGKGLTPDGIAKFKRARPDIFLR
jgi:hypothetical protein